MAISKEWIKKDCTEKYLGVKCEGEISFHVIIKKERKQCVKRMHEKYMQWGTDESYVCTESWWHFCNDRCLHGPRGSQRGTVHQALMMILIMVLEEELIIFRTTQLT